jgi:hypothetical protein
VPCVTAGIGGGRGGADDGRPEWSGRRRPWRRLQNGDLFTADRVARHCPIEDSDPLAVKAVHILMYLNQIRVLAESYAQKGFAMLRRTLLAVLSTALAFVLLPSAPAPAQAEPLTPLPPPSQLVATSVTATTAVVSWTGPDGPVFRCSMLRLVDGEWQGWLSTPRNHVSLVGLTPDTEYTVAVQAAPMPYSGYSMSPLSAPLTFRTLPE